ncbi:hypothetical protein LTR36_007277 [Oleoguttula mirabilis]|uniref:White collar-2 n=1 Tax=Oleoguttula mirabilis TaxID=1507867 RepID=A0AAV9JA90_9PEZI|nr:hypothetical protein LTR36_007277 [Oleoguttula mirabilis]
MSGLYQGVVPDASEDSFQANPLQPHNGYAAARMGVGMQAMPPTAADLSMLGDGSGGMLDGLDMDNVLPMDLDISEPGFAPLPPRHATTSSLQDPGLVTGAAHYDNITSSAPPPEAIRTGAGAGPLPTGFGMHAQSNTSTLTEFTKRRNWSQRIIEELKDFLHILTPDGRILYVSPSCKAITGYEPNALIGKFIGEYVHPDDSGIFMREFNESIASGNSLRFFYRFKKDDGTYMIFECDGHPHVSTDPAVPQGYNGDSGNGNSSAGQCKGFFMMARPYPTKSAALLDSFLEHKIENERLMKRIADLKREEAEENAEHDKLYQEQAASLNGMTPSESQGPASRALGEGSSYAIAAPPQYHGMPPPAKPTISNTALTRQNLDSALSAQRPDSIADKMSRYETGSGHMESIELLTGLRYRDGERSHGISTGDTSPALIRGDAGIAIMLDRDREGGKKERKKLKVADEYVCADCGTLDSPEWRKGPKGPKTLCNACGLRWAKKEKKRSGDDGKANSPPAGMQNVGVGPPPQHQPLQPQIPGATPGHPPPLLMPMSTGSS